MNDLEKRLRHTLHELAGTVPPSEDPKADFQRRLASHRGRRPALIAAAAIAVVAVAGAATLSAQREPTTPAADEKKTDGLVWSQNYDWLRADAGPFVLGTFTRDGETIDVVAWVRDGKLCDAEGHHVAVGGSTDRTPAALVGTNCVPVPTWPYRPTNSQVTTAVVLSEGTLDSGPVPGLMLFMTAPGVATIEVRRGDGAEVAVRELAKIDTMNLFLADFAGTSQGFGYTAYDGAGEVVETAIT